MDAQRGLTKDKW